MNDLEDFIKSLKPTIELLNELQKEQYDSVSQRIDYIITNNINDPTEIEHLLDALLDLSYWNITKAEELFNRLTSYYETLNQEASLFYKKLYLEMKEED